MDENIVKMTLKRVTPGYDDTGWMGIGEVDVCDSRATTQQKPPRSLLQSNAHMRNDSSTKLLCRKSQNQIEPPLKLYSK